MILDLGSLTRRGFMVDRVPCRNIGGEGDRAEGARPERRWEKTDH